MAGSTRDRTVIRQGSTSSTAGIRSAQEWVPEGGRKAVLPWDPMVEGLLVMQGLWGVMRRHVVHSIWSSSATTRASGTMDRGLLDKN